MTKKEKQEQEHIEFITEIDNEDIKFDKRKEESKIEIAKKMKEKNIDISTIVELTGLTEEQIKVI